MTDTCSGLHDPYEDQLAAARYRAERDMLAQAMERVADDIEWTFLGFEGEDDAPAMRWAREFRAALGSLHAPGFQKSRKVATSLTSHSDASDVTMSAHDLLPEEECEAIELVREHGGIEELRRMFRDADSRRVELCGALGIDLNKGWSEAMAAMRLRLVPRSMEWLVEAWPRFEDGEPVRFLDDFERYGDESGVSSVTMYSDGSFALNFRAYSKGERVKRPAPKVLDADGVEIRVGDEVWSTNGEFDGKRIVKSVHHDSDEPPYALFEEGRDTWSCLCCYLTHRSPVLAADGRPLREGETVWHKQTGRAATVKGFDRMLGKPCAVIAFAGIVQSVIGTLLTHERPDSWERLEEDAGKNPFDYCKDVGHRLDTCENSEAYKARDLVRRCRAMAGRDVS